ncbi:vWA domain-containing protein [Pontibacter sp. JAM-7]|uniref:vWA domain-containing protein n=1 Tax=Pontibacter sp. JAM-7 TaxID=3366581 RepID=UPI003AF797D8
MFEFAWLWVWLLTPLPLLVRAMMPAAAAVQKTALKVPFMLRLESAVGQQPSKTVRQFSAYYGLALLVWLLLLAAAARPQWLGDPVPQPQEGRDLMLAVDLSESMLEKDFELNGRLINRLMATRIVAGDFIERRKSDRVGLILFADQAYMQAPLTRDRDTVKTFLDEARVGLAGKSTAIGDAIGLAVKRFKELASKQRILILLTDGTNNAGAIEPLEAADLASSYDVKIYTIGVAGEGQLAGPIGQFLTHNAYIDATVPTSIDEKTLIEIADQTGGRYFRARDIEQLAEIYSVLDELEPVSQDDAVYRPVQPLFHWPLLAGMLLGVIMLAIRQLSAARGGGRC